MATWTDYIKVEQLPEDYQLIAEAIGIENTVKLAYAVPSVYVYLKNPDRLFSQAKIEFIKDEYANAGPDRPFKIKDIAIKCKVSIRFVYNVITAPKEVEHQLSIPGLDDKS